MDEVAQVYNSYSIKASFDPTGLISRPDHIKQAVEGMLKRLHHGDSLPVHMIVAPSDRVDEVIIELLPVEQQTRQEREERLLEQARRQQLQLQQASKDAPTGQAPEKVLALKAAIERNQRDIDSLQRELSRRPVAAKP